MPGFGGYGREHNAEQRRAAKQLLEHGWVRWANRPGGPVGKVTAITLRGMVRLANWQGEFAPHLFVPADAPTKRGHRVKA